MQKSPLSHHQNSSTTIPHTMSSSASLTPQVEPPTTIKTKSSFSEIEQLVDPQPHTSKNSSYITPQLQVPQQTEPFVSPLTETNLNYHKSTFPPSRETKQRYVHSFIQHQKMLLEQEQELQRKTKAEIQSMIPLDTKSIDEELVRDDQHQLWDSFAWPLPHSQHHHLSPSTSVSTTRRRHSIQAQHRPSINHQDGHDMAILNVAENGQQSEQQVNNDPKLDQDNTLKKPWVKTLARWIRLGQMKKLDVGDDNNDEQEQQRPATTDLTAVESGSPQHDPQHENEHLGLNVDPSFPLSAASTQSPGSTPDVFYGPDQYVNQRQPRKAARHVSWSGGTSFEDYKRQKICMIEEGLYGLSNANIARALGSSQLGSKAPILFLPAKETITTWSPYGNDTLPIHQRPAPIPTPTPDPHDPAVSHGSSSSSSIHQKKDPNISFMQQTLSSAKSLLRSRKSIRKKSNHIDPQAAPQPSIDTSSSNTNNDERCRGGETDTGAQGNTLQQLTQTTEKQEKERRRRSIHVNGRYSPSLSALKEEEWAGAAGSSQQLVAFRYPKMVRIKDLRDAAIQILSTTDTGGVDDDGSDGADGDDDTDSMAMMGDTECGGGRTAWLARDKAKWKMEPNELVNGSVGKRGVSDLDTCAKGYRKSIKRFSDPGGTGLPAPPFSIGRPISSLYY